MTVKILDVDISDVSIRKGKSVIVRDITTSIGRGEMLGIVGGSGAGKSTLLELLTGQLPLHKGSGSVLGYDLRTQRRKIQQIVGYVPQQDFRNMYMELSAWDNIWYFAIMYDYKFLFSHKGKELIREVLAILDISSDLWKIPVKRLSGGERKRVSIAMGILHQPQLLFLDEPTTGLDEHLKTQVFNYLKKINTELGITVVLVSHNLLICEMVDNLLLLKDGVVIGQGHPNTLLRSLPSEGTGIKVRFEWVENMDERISQLVDMLSILGWLYVGRNLYKFFCYDMPLGLGEFLRKVTQVGLVPLDFTIDDATLLDYFLLHGK